jgi:hypothetical protein
VEYSELRRILPLVTQYAHTRRAGHKTSGQITMPEYVLLRRIAIVADTEAILYATLRDGLCDPYRVNDPILDGLPQLVERGLLNKSNDEYRLTPVGHALLRHGESTAHDYIADRICLPSDDLARLAAILHDISERQRLAPEPANKAQQDRVPRLRRYDQRQTPPVQLEFALYALQRARDDAHMSAWRKAQFQGPPFDLLSRVWHGDASTMTELVERCRHRISSEDVARFVDELHRDGYLTLDFPLLTTTQRGRNVRDEIERETDRVYFAPWPEIDIEWVCAQLEMMVKGFDPTS